MFPTTALLGQDIYVLYYTYRSVRHAFEFLLRGVTVLWILRGAAAKTGII